MKGGPEGRRTTADRASWPVRIVRLGDAVEDDLSRTTTVAERLAMMWPLTVEAWALAGQPLPDYGRGETPVTRRAWNIRR